MAKKAKGIYVRADDEDMALLEMVRKHLPKETRLSMWIRDVLRAEARKVIAQA
jgi:hypothetical protein